eukprot:EG_transcript_27927
MRRFFPQCLPQSLTQLGHFVPCRSSFVASQPVPLATTKPKIRKSLGEATVAAGDGGKKRGKDANAAVQTLFRNYDIDLIKVVQRYPAVRGYDVQRVERVTSYLAGLGVDVKRVVEQRPAVLAGQVEKYDAVVQWLRHNGVNVARAVGTNPGVLSRPISALQEIGDAICSCGHSVANVVHRFPSILRMSSANVSLVLQPGELTHPMKELSDEEP